MKINNLLCLCFAAYILSACDNSVYSLKTTVRRDGTCERELSFLVDTASANRLNDQLKKGTQDGKQTVISPSLADDEYFQYLNTDWPSNTSFTQKETERNDSVVQVVRTRYSSVEEIDAYPIFKLEDVPLLSHSTLSKKNHVFYTDYTFTETFDGLPRFFTLPITDYMTENEAHYWLMGSPVSSGNIGSPFETKKYWDELEEKFWQYISACWLNDKYDLIVRHYDRIPAAPYSKTEFLGRKKEFIDYMLANHYNLLDNNLDDASMMSSFFSTNMYSDALNTFLKDSSNYIENFYVAACLLYVDYCVQLPDGKLLDDGNGLYQEDGLHFILTPARLLLGEYALSATCRCINWWLVSMLLLLIIIAIASALYISRKRNYYNPN